MTTNQTIDGVPRDRLELCVKALASTGYTFESNELRALLDAPAPCAHEWTDDGGHLLVCTACGAQEDHDPRWLAMETAPTDGTMLRLLVEFDEHSTEDAEQAITIGANNLDNDGEDEWRFAGWCWSHDHFTEGKGTPVGWLPMLDDPVSKPAAQPQGEPVGEVVDMKYERVRFYRATGDTSKPYLLPGTKLYAEQPAPVEVERQTLLELQHELAILHDTFKLYPGAWCCQPAQRTNGWYHHETCKNWVLVH